MKYPFYLFILCLCAIGCSAPNNEKAEIEDLSAHEQRDSLIEYPTFSADMATFFYENCTPCHREGEAGPFPFLTYEDIKKKTKTIKYVVETRYMPPWPADPNYRHFAGERYLSDNQIKNVVKWIDNGAPIGDTSAIPKPPEYPDGSQIGKPDMVISMRDSVLIRGINQDHFMFIKIPFELPGDTFIRVMEFVPGNRKLAHHMNGHLINYQSHKKGDHYEGEYAVFPDSLGEADAYAKMGLLNDDGSVPQMQSLVCNYLPGVAPVIYPEAMSGFKVSKNATFFMQDMHYGPTAIDQWDLSHINIWFAKSAPKRLPRETQMGTLGISKVEPELVIPPDTVMLFKTHYQIPQAISLLMVNPHMHLLGRQFKAYAVTLKKDTIPLVKIDKWDFRWQYYYKFPKMVKIPAGATIWAEGLFDNTMNNPFNPFFPAKEVREPEHSMKTTDEMFQFIFTYLPYEEGDEDIDLTQAQL